MNTSTEAQLRRAQEQLDFYIENPELAPSGIGYPLELFLALEPQIKSVERIIAATFTALILLHAVSLLYEHLQKASLSSQMPELETAKEILPYMLMASIGMLLLLEIIVGKLNQMVERRIFEQLEIDLQEKSKTFYVTPLSAKEKMKLQKLRQTNTAKN